MTSAATGDILDKSKRTSSCHPDCRHPVCVSLRPKPVAATPQRMSPHRYPHQPGDGRVVEELVADEWCPMPVDPARTTMRDSLMSTEPGMDAEAIRQRMRKYRDQALSDARFIETGR